VEEYRIEKELLDVAVTLIGGDVMRGHMFVQPSPYSPRGCEDPRDVLNSSEPFFPLGLPGGEILLIAKERVLDVRPQVGEPDDGEGFAPTALLQLTLADHTVHVGTMRLEVPTVRPRLLDFLNHSHERFLALYTNDGVRLINRSMIERVRPLD
jgi:hypothetical protein